MSTKSKAEKKRGRGRPPAVVRSESAGRAALGLIGWLSAYYDPAEEVPGEMLLRVQQRLLESKLGIAELEELYKIAMKGGPDFVE